MKREALGLQVTPGTADILPREQAFIRQIEQQILDLFSTWAYSEVSTPTLEYLAAINPQIAKEDNLYKFFDREGSILAMRPELTTPIARMVATRLKGAALPLRLCYAAEVFRYEKSPAKREFRQTGVELVGSSSPFADAEVIALAVDALKGAGVRGFQINIGHIELFRGLIEDMGIEAETVAVVERLIARKDFVALGKELNKAGVAKNKIEVILSIPSFHGGEEVLDRVEELLTSKRTAAAVENLRQVYRALAHFGVNSEVAIDLGVLRGFDYYTGCVFEGYAPGLGFPVCEGGRYDGLLGNFGYECPATGFAINLEYLGSILPNTIKNEADILVSGNNMQAVIAKAKELRAGGSKVEIALESMGESQAKEYAKLRGITQVVVV